MMTATAALPSSTALRAAAADARRARLEHVLEVLAREDALDGGAGVLAGLGAALVQVRHHDLGGGDVEAAAAAEGEAEQGGERQRRDQHHDQRRQVAQRAAQVLPGDGEDLLIGARLIGSASASTRAARGR